MATGKLSNFKKETLSFFYTVFTLLFLISIFTHDPDDPSFFNSGLSDSVNNYIGIVGAYISFLFFYLFGKVSFLIPIIFIYIILKNYMSNIIYTTASKVIRTLLMIILLLSLCGLLSQYDISLGDDINNLSGGIIGLYLSEILMSFFGMTGSILIMSFIFLFSSIKFLDLSLQIIALKISNLLKYSHLKLRFHFMQAIDKYKLMKEKKVKSLLINTVHDSIIADVYPGEERVMADIFKQGTADVIPALKSYYNIDFNVPLDTELKIGYNWLDMKEAI